MKKPICRGFKSPAHAKLAHDAHRMEQAVQTMIKAHQSRDARNDKADSDAVDAALNLRYNKRLDRFTLRGLAKVNTQWHLYCLVHNIEKLAHHGYAQ